MGGAEPVLEGGVLGLEVVDGKGGAQTPQSHTNQERIKEA